MLTLKEAEITKHSENGGVTAGIYSSGNLNIQLGDGASSCPGLYAGGNLTIAGTGTLTATGGSETDTSFGVYVGGKITMESGILGGIGGTASGKMGNSIGVYTKSIEVKDGELSGKGGEVQSSRDSIGVCTIEGGDITMSGGELVGTGGASYENSMGVSVSGHLTINGGTLKGTGGMSEKYFSEGVAVRKDIDLADGTLIGIGGESKDRQSYGIRAGAAGGESWKITQKGGKLQGSAGISGRSNYGVYVNGSICIEEGNFEGTAGTSAGNICYGVYAERDITVEGGTLTGTGDHAGINSYGVCAEKGNIKVNGGEMVAQSGNGGNKSCAFVKAPITSPVSRVWYGENALKTTGPEIAGRLENSVYTDNKYVKIEFVPEPPPSPHIHYYGSQWKFDNDLHWKECSCGARSQIADHDYGSWTIITETEGDSPGTSSRICKVCEYEQTETNTYRTLTDPETGIAVNGYFTSDAILSVGEAVLHEAGTCPVCDEIREGQDAGELLHLYDISLSSGIHNGAVEVIIPVDAKYNHQPLILLHCMNQKEERLITEGTEGRVGGTFTGLSPFAVLETKKVESISLTPASLTLEVGKGRVLQASVTPEDAYNKALIWRTSNKNVVTVSDSGQIQAVKAGTATITCTAADGGGAAATCKVTVQNTVTPLILLKGTAGKNSIRLNWNQISNADGYEIYGSLCGGKYSYKKIKTITKGTTKTWTQNKLKSANVYKYYIKAYKLVNGRKLYLRTSKTSHIATTGGRYTNVKSLVTTFTDLTLAKGKTRQISARVTPVKKGGKLVSHVAQFRYNTTNSKVATVTESGKIKAVGKGKCSVYVYANNGMTRRIQITVK